MSGGIIIDEKRGFPSKRFTLIIAIEVFHLNVVIFDGEFVIGVIAELKGWPDFEWLANVGEG